MLETSFISFSPKAPKDTMEQSPTNLTKPPPLPPPQEKNKRKKKSYTRDSDFNSFTICQIHHMTLCDSLLEARTLYPIQRHYLINFSTISSIAETKQNTEWLMIAFLQAW